MLWSITPAAAQSEVYILDDAREWRAVEEGHENEDQTLIDRTRRLLADDRPAEARKLITPFIDSQKGTGNPYMAQAYLLRGDAYVAADREYTALYDYEALIRQYPQSEEFRTALEREFEIAKAYLNGKRMKLMGMRIGSATDIGVELLIRIQERAPGSRLAEAAAIELADYYYRTREMKLARDAYDLYLLNHPNGPNRMKASQRRIYAEVARFKGPQYDAAGLLNARVLIRGFERQYPAEAERTGLNEGMVTRIDESLASQLLDAADWYVRQNDAPSARLTLRRLLLEHPESVAAEQARRMMRQRGWQADIPGEPAFGPEPVEEESMSAAEGSGS